MSQVGYFALDYFLHLGTWLSLAVTQSEVWSSLEMEPSTVLLLNIYPHHHPTDEMINLGKLFCNPSVDINGRQWPSLYCPGPGGCLETGEVEKLAGIKTAVMTASLGLSTHPLPLHYNRLSFIRNQGFG